MSGVAGTQVIHVTPDSRKDDLSTSEEGRHDEGEWKSDGASHCVGIV
jgi:hypothetical protein